MSNYIGSDVLGIDPIAEQAGKMLIGGAIMEIGYVREFPVEAEWFQIVSARWIYDVLLNISKRQANGVVELNTLVAGTNGQFDDDGQLLIELIAMTTEAVPSSATFQQNANILRESFVRRSAWYAATGIRNSATDVTIPLERVEELASRSIIDAFSAVKQERVITGEDVAEQTSAAIDAILDPESHPDYIDIGIPAIAEMLDYDIQVGLLMAVIADTGVGKSTLVWQMVTSVAMIGHRVLCITGEASVARVSARMATATYRYPEVMDVAWNARGDVDKVTPHTLGATNNQIRYNPAVLEGVQAQARMVAALPIDWVQGSTSVAHINGMLARESGRGNPYTAVFIDSVQTLVGGQFGNSDHIAAVAATHYALQDMAHHPDYPALVVAISHTNASMKGLRPTRDSMYGQQGAFAYDTILTMYDEKAQDASRPPERVVEVGAAKTRWSGGHKPADITINYATGGIR